MNPKRASLLFFFFFLSMAAPLHAAPLFDYSLWDAFLKKYVNEKGEVDYQAVKKDPKLLDDYWTKLTSVDVNKTLKKFPREEALAFWLNAYHASLIKLVVEHYPVTSVERIPGFWDITILHLEGVDVTNRERRENFEIKLNEKNLSRFSLNDIRAKKLLRVYRDERLHLLLSLAARGGPRLTREAFSGSKVQGRIFLLTRQFVNDSFYVDIVPGRKKILISPIFKWHEKSFNLDFGAPEPLGNFSVTETAVLSFLAYYLEDESKIDYLQEAKYKIEYFGFDWSLNDWKGSAA